MTNGDQPGWLLSWESEKLRPKEIDNCRKKRKNTF